MRLSQNIRQGPNWKLPELRECSLSFLLLAGGGVSAMFDVLVLRDAVTSVYLSYCPFPSSLILCSLYDIECAWNPRGSSVFCIQTACLVIYLTFLWMSNKLRRWSKDVAWGPVKTTDNTLTALGWTRLWSGLHHQLNINTITKDSYVSQKGSTAM